MRQHYAAILGILMGSSVSLVVSLSLGVAEERRYIERVPTATVRMEKQQVTTYRQQPVTQTHEYDRVVFDPVVTYQCQRRVVGWWNPFTGPYETYQMVPVTSWKSRTEKVAYSTTRYDTVRETKIVERPVRYLGFVDRQGVVNVDPPQTLIPVAMRQRFPSGVAQGGVAQSGVAQGGFAQSGVGPVAGNLAGGAPVTARPANTTAQRYGGIGRLNGDYPRQAMVPMTTLR